MINTNTILLVAAVAVSALQLHSVNAFIPEGRTGKVVVELPSASSKTVLFQGDGTGGWGIGSSREISPEEYARGDRAGFDGYKIQDRGDFMRTLRETQDLQRQDEMDELLGVAAMAGINVKDPSTRLNKFDNDLFEEDDDDLDVSVDL